MPDKFLVVKKGYSIEAVDAYVTNVEKELSSFRKRESAISSAIVSAEESAAQIIKNAEKEAKTILDDIDLRLEEVKTLVESEHNALRDFCSEYDKTLRNYFSAKADDLAAPLKEKLNGLSALLDEVKEEKQKNQEEVAKIADDEGGKEESSEENKEGIKDGEAEDPFGVIKNYF